MTSAARATPGRGPLAYRLDDFTDGWVEDAPHVMLLHGIAESAEAFNGWVPHLSRRWPVLRPDLRGHGQSPAVRDGDRLTISGLADDIEQLVARLALKRVHVMGAKLGAQVALELAQRRLPWMASLNLAGVLISPSAALAQWIPDWLKLVDEQGVAGWARATMPGRMGSALPPAGYEWWIQFMANTRPETARACFRLIADSGEPAALERIDCPTQIIAPAQPLQGGDFNQQPSLAEVHRWAARIDGARVVTVSADSYHIAATHPDACAALTAQFIEEYTA